jgi:hypothetical protein
VSKHFDGRYEFQSIERGMDRDMGATVGQNAFWYIWDAADTDVDPVYDTGENDNALAGRRWYSPIPVTVLNTIRTEGAKQWGDGLYTADTVHLILSSNSAQRNAMPDLVRSWRDHLKDRIVFHGLVFTPTRIELLCLIEDSYTVIGVDAVQVNPEELVDDIDFRRYSA